ncbi:hypothetical protein JOQ06_024630, partial [Pogonophryne albipinna]
MKVKEETSRYRKIPPMPKHVHPNVHQSLDFLQQLIAKGNNPTLENGDIDSESQSGWEEEEQKRAHTIVGRSPYTQCFQEAFQEAQAAIGEAEEDEDGHQPNRYHCPKILKVLLGNYMGIFPLWSGAMLGDLRRYARDKTLDPDTSETKTLWEQGQTELVVSVIKSQDQCVNLRYSELMTLRLRPEELICGEVIEAYMRATLNQYDPAHRIFQIDHYTNGVILGGSREQMSRHLMRNVNLDTFDAAVSFVNVNNNHWRFVYLHVPSRSLFVMDPAAAEQDLHLSTTAVQCYNHYFRMRQNLYGKQVWGSLKWKAATIPHTVQQDTTSCGVFVMQMAKEAIQSFPAIPSFNMKNSPRDMCCLREEMAEELL